MTRNPSAVGPATWLNWPSGHAPPGWMSANARSYASTVSPGISMICAIGMAPSVMDQRETFHRRAGAQEGEAGGGEQHDRQQARRADRGRGHDERERRR